MTIFVGKREEKRPLGRPWRRWEYNVRMELRETAWKSVDWLYLIQDRDQWWVVSKIMNLRIPEKAGNF
jgi:hypothetical protein